MEGFDGQEVGVVNDGDDEFALGVEVASFGDEASLAFVIVGRFRVAWRGRAGAGGCARCAASG